MSKLPAFQMYPGDWMKDPALRSCSVAARGLWMDMLCLMFECDRRGHLQTPTGKPFSPEQIARMTGCSGEEVSRLTEELETSGVFSRTKHGIIYSRRQVRDEETRADHRARQDKYRKSHKTEENSDDDVTHPVTPLSHPSSSSSSASAVNTNTPPSAGANDPHPKPIPPSAGSNGELMTVTWLCEELGITLMPAQRATTAQNIAFTARETGKEGEDLLSHIREAAEAAKARGEPVDAWYLADGKWRNTGGNGNAVDQGSKPGAVARVDRALGQWDRALAERRRAGPVRAAVQANAGLLPSPGVRP